MGEDISEYESIWATLLVEKNLVYQYISTQNIILKLQKKLLTWKYKNKKTTVSIGQWVYSPLYAHDRDKVDCKD